MAGDDDDYVVLSTGELLSRGFGWCSLLFALCCQCTRLVSLYATTAW